LLAGAAGLFTLFVSMAKQKKKGISERTVRGWIVRVLRCFWSKR